MIEYLMDIVERIISFLNRNSTRHTFTKDDIAVDECSTAPTGYLLKYAGKRSRTPAEVSEAHYYGYSEIRWRAGHLGREPGYAMATCRLAELEIGLLELLNPPELYKYIADRKARNAQYLTGDAGDWVINVGTGVRIPALDLRYDYFDADGDPYRAGQLRALQDWYLLSHPEAEAKV